MAAPTPVTAASDYLSKTAGNGPKSMRGAIADPIARESRYIRLPELRELVPFSTATIWRKSKDGSMPAPIKLSARISAWNRAEVMAFLAEKEAA